MSPQEAAWFDRALRRMAPAELSPILNVGSSTLEYRTAACPHIQRVLLGPLLNRGVRVLNVDLKEDDGVDIAGDILDRSFRSKIASLGIKAILCNNLLEHVNDVTAMCAALADICPDGGVLCLSVPHAYPFHPDPIDNGFRPSLMQLEEIFKPLGFYLVHGEIVEFGSYGKSVAARPKLLLRDMYLLLLAPFNEIGRRVLLGNYRFFRSRFQVVCAIFKMAK